jgi:mono/diheme cytochrome c family protein
MNKSGWALLLAGLVACDQKPPAVQAPVPPPVVVEKPQEPAEPPEPEEGTSARRIHWSDVTIDAIPGTMEKLAKAGAGVYQQQCAVCHGKEGKGDGPAADVLSVKPRNFTRAYYKFKTSGQGEMPYDEDLYRTISAGIPAAGMPSFGDLTAFERWALVAYVKELSKITLPNNTVRKHFEQNPPKTKIEIPKPPPKESADLENGKKLYVTGVQCIKCHGEKGVGDGPSAEDLTDAFDNPIRPPDITRGEVTFKAGARVEDIYRVMTIGMAGTPMPSFTSSMSEKDRWDLAYYVTSLYRPIDPGERLFLKVGCTSCHTIGKGQMIGPDLAGVMQRRDATWMKKWLKDPPSMLATDETARKLLEEFLTPMPSYGLTTKEVDLLIEYLKTLPPAKPAGEGSK